jgi:hypothetical protein
MMEEKPTHHTACGYYESDASTFSGKVRQLLYNASSNFSELFNEWNMSFLLGKYLIKNIYK